jgi:hypothetical protein
LTIETQPASNDERKKIVIRNILVPIDGSEYAFNASQYAARIARNERAQLFCIHIVTPRMPYGYATPAASSIESQNYEDIKHIDSDSTKASQSFSIYNREYNCHQKCSCQYFYSKNNWYRESIIWRICT